MAPLAALLTRTMPAMTMTELVGVNGASAGARARADKRALLPSGDAANRSAGGRCTGDRQLIAMLLPERTAMTMASHLRRRHRRRQTKCCENQKNNEKLFHYSPPDVARRTSPADES